MNNDALPVGCHIKVSRGAYAHHGVHVGRGRVIHFSGEPGRKLDAAIREDSRRDFLAGGVLEVVTYGERLPPAEAIRRARSRLGEGGYHLLFRNCEHFAAWCVCGREVSEQVIDGAAGFAGASGAAVATAGAMGVVSGAGVVAGLSGAGVMSGLAAAGGIVGGGAVVGLAALGVAPALVTIGAMRRVLEDREDLPPSERSARAAGRVAAGSVAGLGAAGITSGLAAIGATLGGGMVARTAAAVAAPAVVAVGVGYGVYRAARWLVGRER